MMPLTEAQLNRVLERSVARGILLSALGSAAQRAAFSASIRRGAVFSARVVNADYLTALFNEVANLLQGGYNNDKAAVRLRLKRVLMALGYTPENGFPGEAAEYDMPPAEPGSLQDLSSNARLNLILDTQGALMRGAVQKAQGEESTNARMFPWWELVRIESRKQPRGSVDSGTMGWPQRWLQARGPAPVTYRNQTRLIAPKGHWVWFNLGSSAEFDDALDVDHPPFAFRSGMGWRQVHWTEGRDMGLELPGRQAGGLRPEAGGSETQASSPNPQASSLEPQALTLPPPQASVKRLSKPVRSALEDALKDYFGDKPVRSTRDILGLRN